LPKRTHNGIAGQARNDGIVENRFFALKIFICLRVIKKIFVYLQIDENNP